VSPVLVHEIVAGRTQPDAVVDGGALLRGHRRVVTWTARCRSGDMRRIPGAGRSLWISIGPRSQTPTLRAETAYPRLEHSLDVRRKVISVPSLVGHGCHYQGARARLGGMRSRVARRARAAPSAVAASPSTNT
jgi:hypothetical protein